MSLFCELDHYMISLYPDRDAHDIFIGEIMKIIDRK